MNPERIYPLLKGSGICVFEKHIVLKFEMLTLDCLKEVLSSLDIEAEVST